MKTTPEELIKEALTVRDDGIEPKYKADEYESALLHVARSVITSDEANALIVAADRARARDELGKAAPSSAIGLDAERVAKSGSAPRYTRDDYHGEMLEISKREARSGETPAAAFTRLIDEGRFDDLYAAGERAEVVEVEAAMTKAAPEDRFYPMLLDLAQMRKRAGETIEAACARLLNEDPVVRDAYAATQGL
ncbi:MAG: hypothetical protein L6Q99_06250 [Planctomycetes bacterium]|nr:hypothetical protein [Planctomycetota bacterium]